MAIYGTAILSLCLIAGLLLGRLTGFLLGTTTDVGGVGIAMLLLVIATDRLRKHGCLSPQNETGIQFWSLMYIPVVVAMAANLNVRGALHGGPVAILAALVAVVCGFCLVPVIGRMKK